MFIEQCHQLTIADATVLLSESILMCVTVCDVVVIVMLYC